MESTANSTTQTGQIEYQDWLPTRETLGYESSYRVTGIRSNSIQENKSQIKPSVYEFLSEGLPQLITPVDLPFESMSGFLGYPNANIVQVDVSEQRLINSLSENNFRKENSNNGFSVYGSNSSERRAAVDGGTLVMNSQENYSYDGVRIAVDTKQGTTPRLVEQRESANRLINTFNDWTVLSIGLGGTANALLSGDTITIEGEMSAINSIEVYESASDIPQIKLEDQIAEAIEEDGVTNGQLHTSGRVAVVEITARTKSGYVSQGMRTLIS
jgi:hypothetical protein